MTLDTTKADDIALVIEEAIVSGELEPGTVLRQEQLSEQFNVSRTPIREALRRLAALGLVSFVPNRGVRVRTISREELHEAFMVRAELEALATEVAAAKITPEDLAELEEAEQHFAKISKDLRAREPGEARRSIMGDWVRANHAFHDVIYRVADLPLVEQLAKSARRSFSGPGRLGAGRPLDRRPVREERRAAPRDPAGARRRQRRRRAGARARARPLLVPAARGRSSSRSAAPGRSRSAPPLRSPHSRCLTTLRAWIRSTNRRASNSAGSRPGRRRASTRPTPTRRARRSSSCTRRRTSPAR